MSFHEDLFERIRVRPRVEDVRQEAPRCDHKGCDAHGEFKAPKGRGAEGQYFRFCLDHVKAYNQTYNYFKGMEDEAVAAFVKDAATGHRPTWTIGVKREKAEAGFAADLAPDLAGDLHPLFNARRAKAAAPQRPRRPLEAKALETLNLPESATPEQIRTRYTELVKRLHPDANGGDRSSETRLQDVIKAYKTLKSAKAV